MDMSDSAIQDVAPATATKSTDHTHKKLSEHLINAVNIVIKKILSKTNYSFFKKFYPDIALEDPDCLKQAHEQLWNQLENVFREDMDNYLSEQHVREKLDELNLFIERNKTYEEMSWRPSGDAYEDIRDHRCKSKLKQLENLQNLLLRFQAANAKLEQSLDDNHEEILTIKKRAFDLDQQNRTKLKALSAERDLKIMEELFPLSVEPDE